MPDNVIVSEISIKEGNTMTQNKILTAEFLEKVLGGVSGDRTLMGYDITDEEAKMIDQSNKIVEIRSKKFRAGEISEDSMNEARGFLTALGYRILWRHGARNITNPCA